MFTHCKPNKKQAQQTKSKLIHITISLLYSVFCQSDLLDEVTLEGDVLRRFVRNRHGDDVGQPLSLVDDGVGEGQLHPVLHLHLATPYHLAQLLADPVWDANILHFSKDE